MSGVDGWGIDSEAAQLSRDPLEGDDDWSSGRRRCEQLVRLDVECRQYCREQTPLDSTGDGQYSQEDDQNRDVRRLGAYQSLRSSV